MLTYNNWFFRKAHSWPARMLIVMSLFSLHACGGKVANLSAAAGGSFANLSFLSSTLYGIQVGEVKTGISTSGGYAPLLFSISSGALPEGLVLDTATGEISGTIAPALAEKEYLMTVLVTDSAALTASKTFTGKIASGGAILKIQTTAIAKFIAGVSYQYPILTIGGTAPFTYSIYTGILPTGVTIDKSTGVISGTPAVTAAGGTYAFGVKVVDAEGQVSKSDTFLGTTLTNPVGSVHLLTTTLNGISVGAVTTGLATSGGSTPLNFSVTAGTIPTGLVLDPLTGTITGSIGVGLGGTTYAFSVTVTDASSTTETKLYTGSISAGSSALTLHTASISLFTAGVAYSFPFTVSGGYSPYTFAVSAGTLPTGLTLNTTTGIISGTPLITTGGQSYNFTFAVTDTSAQVQSRQFSGVVAANAAAAVAIISTTLPGVAVGAITTGLSTSGGVAPLTFSVLSGALPTGLTLDTTTGVVSGTISVASANTGYAAAIKVIDSTGSTDIKTFTGVVGAGNSVMAIASTTIANFAAGISYTNPIIVTGGVGPFVFTISSGTLPSGIVINATTGIISGTPLITIGGQPFSFTLNVADSASQSQSRAFSGSVIANAAASISILSTSLPGIGVGAVTTGITTSGGVPPLAFSVTSGALPTGLTISATTGIISGTVGVGSANTAYALAISVTDSSNSTAVQSFTGVVAAGTAVLALNSTSIAGFTAGIAYSCPLVTTGGTPAYSFAISSGALPSGVSISSSTGALTGTPLVTSGGSAYTFTVTVTDASAQTQSRSFVGTISSNSGAALSMVSTTINGMTVGAVTSGLSTSGGISPLVFAVTSGSLPSGLSLNTSTGAITGTIPVTSANLSYAAAISVTDAANTTASKTFSGTVSAGSSALVLNSTTVSPFVAGITYSYPLVATNGVPTYGFTVSAGTLPAGISLNASTGVISGTPTVATANQAYGFTITVTDSASQTKFQTFVGTVATSSAANLQITTATITAPTAGSPYVAGISVSGGTSPYVFTVSSGALPSGITINASTGVISGTPTYATKGTTFLFIGTVTDASNLTASVTYSGTVGTYATTLYPASFSAASPGALYSVALSTLGGQSTFTYAITAGTLPSGLSLNTSTGLISGTIAEAEAGLTKSVTITSTDANSIVATTGYSIATSAFAVSVSTTSLTSAVEMTAYTNSSASLGATGGTGPYTFEYTGTLPTGVGLTSTGAFFGTPALNSGALSAGTTYTINVRGMDSAGVRSAKKTLTLAVTISLPAMDAVTPANATLGASYSHTMTATGGRAPYTFAVTGGSLPTGVSLSSGGVLSGIASVAATCPTNQFTIWAIDALSQISAASVKCITTLNGVNITNAVFPVVVIGVNYSSTVSVTGGTAPYTYSSTGLPTGVTVNSSTGALAGFTNAAAGDFSTYLTVSDSSSPALSTTRTFTFTVRSPLTLAAATMTRGAALSAYGGGSGYQITPTGGQTPYTFVITSGSLPSGLAMSTSGLVSGTPVSSAAANGGAYSINVSATDALGSTTSAATFGLTIQTTPKIMDTKLPAALLNSAYSYDLVRTGGNNEFNGSTQATRLTYALASGSSLPIGLTLGASTGRIYGTPTSNGATPYTFTIEVTDAYNFKGSKTLTLAINSVAKTLDLKTAHFSDPCSGIVQCTPNAFDISLLTATTAPATVSDNTQQFLVSIRNETVPKSIQIAKIDSTGRVPKASSTALSINVPLPANMTSIQYIKVADIDQDGFQDIIFSESTVKQICVLWNTGTVDAFGMPNSFIATKIDCFPMGVGGVGNAAAPTSISVLNNLRPDATNNGKIDVIVTNTSATNIANYVTVLKNICAAGGACTNATTQRPVIFDGFVAFTGTTNATTTISAIASTANVQIGAPVVGVGIPAGARVVSFVANTSITISAAATTRLAGTKLAITKAQSITTATITNASATISATSSTTGIAVGNFIYHSSFPAGTTVASFTASTIVASNVATSTTTGPVTVFSTGPVTHVPLLVSAASHFMRDFNSSAIGWFISPKPVIPSGVVGVNNCPGILIAGLDATTAANGYSYVMRQTYSSSQCQGDFVTHLASDEYISAALTPWLTSVVAEDFNNDGYTDIAVGASNQAQANSAAVRVYLTAGGATFTGGTVINPQLQSRNNVIVGAARLTSFCLDGTTTCLYPSLVAESSNIYSASSAGGISIMPNSCAAPGCSTPFEGTTPTTRIDYPAPALSTADSRNVTGVQTQGGELLFKLIVSKSNVTPTGTTTSGNAVITSVSSTTGVTVGQSISGTNIPANSYVTAFSSGSSTITLNANAVGTGSVTLTIPTVPTLLDIGTAGIDGSNSAPYFLTFPRNGTSTTDPFKGTIMLDVFPAAFSQLAEVGTTRLADINNDGKLDLFSFAVNQGFVGTYVSSASGGVSYDLTPTQAAPYTVFSGQQPNYLANPNQNGCLTGATACFPDPVLNLMGVQQGFPQGGTLYNDNVMDVGDVNYDGIPDVVVNGFSSRGIAVALGTATGDLNAPILYDMGSGTDLKPQSLAFSDLDQDGFLDIVMVGISTSNSVSSGAASWLKGNGDGTFQAAIAINAIVNSCIDPRVVTAIDIDQDGRPELSVLCSATQLVWVSRRNSSGVWVVQSNATLNSGGGALGVGMRWGRTVTSTAGGVDMALVGQDVNSSLRIFNGITLSVTNAGTGAFTVSGNAGAYTTLNGYPTMVEMADLNGDGYGDVVVPMRSTANNTAVSGTYMTCQSTTTGVGTCTVRGWGMEGYQTSSVSIGDLGDDGLPELIIGYGNTVSKFLYRNISRVVNTSY